MTRRSRRGDDNPTQQAFRAFKSPPHDDCVNSRFRAKMLRKHKECAKILRLQEAICDACQIRRYFLFLYRHIIFLLINNSPRN